MRSNWERAGDPKTQAFKHSVLQVFPKAKGNRSSKDPICEHQKAMPTPLASSKIRLWQSISSSNSISSNHISISSRTFSQHLQPACTWVLFISFSCSSTVMSTLQWWNHGTAGIVHRIDKDPSLQQIETSLLSFSSQDLA